MIVKEGGVFQFSGPEAIIRGTLQDSSIRSSSGSIDDNSIDHVAKVPMTCVKSSEPSWWRSEKKTEEIWKGYDSARLILGRLEGKLDIATVVGVE